jgi:transcriptional regulator with XRE-family HTH domain
MACMGASGQPDVAGARISVHDRQPRETYDITDGFSRMARNHTLGRYCPSCGSRLARDNTDTLCTPCRNKAQEILRHPPTVPPDFWEADELQAALASSHMGKVISAYRHHSFHRPSPLSQELVGSWLGITQAQLSRIENGKPIHDLRRLIDWAQTLGIPGSYLWFDVPGKARQRTVHASEEHNGLKLPDGQCLYLPDILTPDDIDRLAQALKEPHRADTEVVGYFERLLHHYGTAGAPLRPLELAEGLIPIVEAIDRFRRDATSTVRGRLLCVRAHYAQLIGRMYYETVDPVLARDWSEKALDSAQQAGDHLMVSYVLLRRTSLAEDEHDPAQMIDLVEAAHRTATLPPQVASLASRHEAEGYVLFRDEAATRRSLDQAVDLLTTARPEYDPPYAAGHSLGFLNLLMANCFVGLGCFAEAVELYEQELPTQTSSRSKAFHLARLARAYVGLKELALARTTALQALKIAVETGGVRALRELREVWGEIGMGG